MATDVMIGFLTADGEERDERWPSLDAFRNWAVGEDLHGIYTVYEEDEDGDWIPTMRGRV